MSENQTRFRSWLGKIFPSVRFLEIEIERIENETKERIAGKDAEIRRLTQYSDALLDRLTRLTTGYGIHEQMPNAVEVEKAIAEAAEQRKKPRTIESLGAELQAVSARAREERKKTKDKVNGCDGAGD